MGCDEANKNVGDVDLRSLMLATAHLFLKMRSAEAPVKTIAVAMVVHGDGCTHIMASEGRSLAMMSQSLRQSAKSLDADKVILAYEEKPKSGNREILLVGQTRVEVKHMRVHLSEHRPVNAEDLPLTSSMPRDLMPLEFMN